MNIPIYLDNEATVDDRVKDLLGRLTLQEKIDQMGMYQAADLMEDGLFSQEKFNEALPSGNIGAISDPRVLPKDSANFVNDVQKHIKSRTRIFIPTMVVSECLHGHMSADTTIFPQSIAMASTFNTPLIKNIATTVAKETTAVGGKQGLAPDLDLAREPRWGRVEETYGEDPYLCERMGVSYIKGLQGESEKLGKDNLVCTLKHYAAHGSPEGGVNLSPVPVGDRQLRELYLPPFEAAVKEAGALSVMNAYSEIDGIPCAASKKLLTDILRDEWGFKGYIIADYESVSMLKEFQRTADTYQEAGRQAVTAGLDLEAPVKHCYGDNLIELIETGRLSEDYVNISVERILRVKFLAGLFDDCYVCPQTAETIVNCDEHRALARATAEESIILLENKNDFLPLGNGINNIAIIGPNAKVAQLGDYTMDKDSVVSPYQGILDTAPEGVEIGFAEGCHLYMQDTSKIEEAVELAKKAQVAIVCVGGTSMVNCGVGWENKNLVGKVFKNEAATCGEGFDRTDLKLPGKQNELVEAIIATGTPTIVVLANGRPYAIPSIAEKCTAMLEMWYCGEEGGHALGDIIFGKVNPSGKLPISFPKNVGQIPVYYNHKPSARGYYGKPGTLDHPGRDYVFTNTKPLYTFGHGLSYTEFEYSELKLSKTEIKPYEKIEASVKVKNIGGREGKEAVLLFINDVVSSVSTPVKQLRAFDKITLQPGEEQVVSFTLSHKDLELYNREMIKVVEPGAFEVMIEGLKETFVVVD